MVKLIDLLTEKIYGDYLFGDKDSGVKIGLYQKETEPDTPAEKELFNLLKKYIASPKSVYSTLNLDNLIPLLKKLKQEYPEIVAVNLPKDSYIYRGTAITEEDLEKLLSKEKNITYSKQGNALEILNTVYSSKRQVQSWSTNFERATVFAFETAKKENKIPTIIRAKVSEADLYFNSEFTYLISTIKEEEVFNIVNPIKADILVLNYKNQNTNIKNKSSFGETLVQEKIQQYIKNGSKGDLILGELPVVFLPNNLIKVGGDLILAATPITSFSNKIEIEGNLYLYSTPLANKLKNYSQEQLKQMFPKVKGRIIV